MAEGSRELQMWLGANVSEAYRAAVLAVADTLEDLRSSDLDELESEAYDVEQKLRTIERIYRTQPSLLKPGAVSK